MLWNLNYNTTIYEKEKEPENVGCKMAVSVHLPCCQKAIEMQSQ